jgi:hypothetical protein
VNGPEGHEKHSGERRGNDRGFGLGSGFWDFVAAQKAPNSLILKGSVHVFGPPAILRLVAD